MCSKRVLLSKHIRTVTLCRLSVWCTKWSATYKYLARTIECACECKYIFVYVYRNYIMIRICFAYRLFFYYILGPRWRGALAVGKIAFYGGRGSRINSRCGRYNLTLIYIYRNKILWTGKGRNVFGKGIVKNILCRCCSS